MLIEIQEIAPGVFELTKDHILQMPPKVELVTEAGYIAGIRFLFDKPLQFDNDDTIIRISLII